jgi:uncharacterized RDD family membrane protein YckC
MEILNDFTAEPKLAPFQMRFAAAFIDFFSFWFIAFILGIFSGKAESTGDGVGFGISGLPALFLFLCWFPLIPIMEGMTGQTFGKRVLKIQVIRQNYFPTNIPISLVRHLFDIIDSFFFIGFILIAASKKKQRIGDLVAKTYVVIK